MKDNGRQMQIVTPGENVSTITAGSDSGVISTTEDLYIRLFTTSDGTKCCISETPLEANAHTIETNIGVWYKVPRGWKVGIYTNDAELMY